MISHVEPIRVRWADTDAAGVVHYASVFRYFEAAEWELFRKVGLRPVPADRSYRFPRVSVSVTYHAGLYADDLIAVRVRPERLGETSITYALEIFRGDTLCVSGTLTAVVLGPDERPIAIPPEVRAALAG